MGYQRRVHGDCRHAFKQTPTRRRTTSQEKRKKVEKQAKVGKHQKSIKMVNVNGVHNKIAIATVLFCILLITPSQAFLKIGRKRAAAKMAADAGRRDGFASMAERRAEKRAEAVNDITSLVNDLKALKELKAIVNAKTLSTRNVRDILADELEKN